MTPGSWVLAVGQRRKVPSYNLVGDLPVLPGLGGIPCSTNPGWMKEARFGVRSDGAVNCELGGSALLASKAVGDLPEGGGDKPSLPRPLPRAGEDDGCDRGDEHPRLCAAEHRAEKSIFPTF